MGNELIKHEENVLVSVLMITYNHFHFIKQAIESFLNQKTTFRTELIICDDKSKDDTASICVEYAKQYPDKIRFISNEVNLGMQRNFIQGLNVCTGTYIAVLEGDDYWNSEDKLQLQVEFMERHSDLAICFTDALVYNENQQSFDERTIAGELAETVFSIEDIARNNFIPTLTCMFRKDAARELPAWIYTSFPLDWPLHILNARHGKIGYIKTVTGVYRKHSGGVCSAAHVITNNDRYLKTLAQLQEEFVDRKSVSIALNQAVLRIYRENVHVSLRDREILAAIRYTYKYILFKFFGQL